MNWPGSFINKIICGDCLEVMKEMPDECVDMVLCSPPYWGLRDYGVEQIFGGDKDCKHEWGEEINGKKLRGTDTGSRKEVYPEIHLSGSNYCQLCQAWKGQLGLEPTPEFYIKHLTQIFNEVKRVLKKEGTFWLNLGDTYFGSGCGTNDYRTPASISISRPELYDGPRPQNLKKHSYLKPKSLCMIPERLAWSLIQNGWILRNKNIWHKRNAMPSSVTDRFSNTYEFVYMFSKSQRYFFALDSVRENIVSQSRTKILQPYDSKYNEAEQTNPKSLSERRQYFRSLGLPEGHPLGKNPGDVLTWDEKDIEDRGKSIASRGDFWEINTQPFPEAHFAVFPEKLCEKPIKAGCPEEVCKKCGKARERIVETINPRPNGGTRNVGDRKDGYTTKLPANPYAEKREIGWTSCNCNAGFEGGIVLDPFAGAGTALYVAKEMKRRFIGIDIKQEYCDMCKERLAQGVL